MRAKWITVSAATLLLLTSLASGSAARTDGPKPAGWGRFIVVLEPGVATGAAVANHTRGFGVQVQHAYRSALSGYAARVPLESLPRLRADERVSSVVRDVPFGASAQLFPNGINRIDGELSSAVAGDGGGPPVDVDVAIIDSGIQSSHPDLNVVGGIDCTGGASSFEDDSFHGTMVSGIVGAEDNGLGVVGVAPGARLWAVKVLRKQGQGTLGTVLCGVDWVTATRLDTNPSNDIEVAAMSLGGKGRDDGNCGFTNRDPLHQAICRSVDAGVVYSVSAGNVTADVAGFVPAAYDEVLNVTAIADLDGRPGGRNGRRCAEMDDTPADFSNFTGPADVAHTIAAPGVCITSTTTGSNYLTGNGTSFANPHVTGTVALCIASGGCAGLSARQITAKILSDAQAYNLFDPAYGYSGDPQHSPDPERSYGYLVRAAAY